MKVQRTIIWTIVIMACIALTGYIARDWYVQHEVKKALLEYLGMTNQPATRYAKKDIVRIGEDITICRFEKTNSGYYYVSGYVSVFDRKNTKLTYLFTSNVKLLPSGLSLVETIGTGLEENVNLTDPVTKSFLYDNPSDYAKLLWGERS